MNTLEAIKKRRSIRKYVKGAEIPAEDMRQILEAAMLAQFIGGARLFQAVTGYPYIVGLGLFGVTVVLYTSLGGFRAVSGVLLPRTGLSHTGNGKQGAVQR